MCNPLIIFEQAFKFIIQSTYDIKSTIENGNLATKFPALSVPQSAFGSVHSDTETELDRPEHLHLLEQIRCARFYWIWLKKMEELSSSMNNALQADQMSQAAQYGLRIDQFRRVCVDTPELQVSAADYYMLPERVEEAIVELKEECRMLAQKEEYTAMENVSCMLRTLKNTYRSLPRHLRGESLPSSPTHPRSSSFRNTKPSPPSVQKLVVENEALRDTNVELNRTILEMRETIAELTGQLRTLQGVLKGQMRTIQGDPTAAETRARRK